MAAGDQFLTYFPEFSNATIYPAPRIAFWVAVAVIQLPISTWGNLYEYGIDLYVAHHLVLEQNNKQSAASLSTPGQITGPINNKSVAEVSYSIDTAVVTYQGASYWNQSGYGINFYNLLRSLGAGVMQLGQIPDGSYVQTGIFPFGGSTYTSYGG